MAVRIMRTGKLPSQREWEGTCWKCRTAVEFLQEDATRHGNDQIDGDWAVVKCPLDGCGNEINGSIKKRPPQSR